MPDRRSHDLPFTPRGVPVDPDDPGLKAFIANFGSEQRDEVAEMTTHVIDAPMLVWFSVTSLIGLLLRLVGLVAFDTIQEERGFADPPSFGARLLLTRRVVSALTRILATGDAPLPVMEELLIVNGKSTGLVVPFHGMLLRFMDGEVSSGENRSKVQPLLDLVAKALVCPKEDAVESFFGEPNPGLNPADLIDFMNVRLNSASFFDSCETDPHLKTIAGAILNVLVSTSEVSSRVASCPCVLASQADYTAIYEDFLRQQEKTMPSIGPRHNPDTLSHVVYKIYASLQRLFCMYFAENRDCPSCRHAIIRNDILLQPSRHSKVRKREALGRIHHWDVLGSWSRSYEGQVLHDGFTSRDRARILDLFSFQAL